MERKDELTILGKNTVYKQDYAPEVLEAFVNKHPEMIIGYVSIALSLPVFVLLQGNLILQKFESVICLM